MPSIHRTALTLVMGAAILTAPVALSQNSSQASGQKSVPQELQDIQQQQDRQQQRLQEQQREQDRAQQREQDRQARIQNCESQARQQYNECLRENPNGVCERAQCE